MHMALALAADLLPAMAYRHEPCNGGGSASSFFGSRPAAALFPSSSAAFGTGLLGPAHLDVFECLSSDERVPGAAAFATPPPLRTAAERVAVVPDAEGYSGHARSVAAEEGLRRTTDRVAFRVRSDEEVLDDGYKWRKYGKKSVKNSPNPRNYYRCSTESCNVKKRVERDKDDPSYVVTMYEGVHNHVSPGTIYYAAQDAASGRFFVAGMHQPLGH
ncbi:hypothetical protein U9M48_017914 [Paspalum notatum var. saurae]|uniref:WRKY domain-containing protein n=1 Tax=Paspalum notatum var. saurae TaxID=547442 RepID=A0AAQ3TAF1_PASNO